MVLDGASNEQKAIYNKTSLSDLVSYQDRSVGASANVNLHNSVRVNDESSTPLQFIYDAADCRLFFTKEMFTDMSKIWEKTRRFMVGDDEICVKGSTKHPTSVTGGAGRNSTASPASSEKARTAASKRLAAARSG